MFDDWCIWWIAQDVTYRPAAHAKGGTDELSAALGQTTVQLGVNMAAVAVPLDALGRLEAEGGSTEGGSPGCDKYMVDDTLKTRVCMQYQWAMAGPVTLGGDQRGWAAGRGAVLWDHRHLAGVCCVYTMDVCDTMCTQEFNTRKMLESGLRRTLHSAQEISAVGPGRYARRFMDYMHKVFS